MYPEESNPGETSTLPSAPPEDHKQEDDGDVLRLAENNGIHYLEPTIKDFDKVNLTTLLKQQEKDIPWFNQKGSNLNASGGPYQPDVAAPDYSNLSEIVRAPNAGSLQSMLAAVNGPASSFGLFTAIISKLFSATLSALSIVGLFTRVFRFKLIEQGKVGVIKENGQYKILQSGWHYLPELMAEYMGEFSLDENLAQYGPLTFVRVPQGEIGLATDNGKPVILQSGVHIVNDVRFQFRERVGVNIEAKVYSQLTFQTVPSGQFGLAYFNNRPVILPPGRHIINSPLFRFDRLINQNAAHESLSTLQVLNIPQHCYGVATYENKPVLIPPGRHIIDSPNLVFHKIIDQFPKQAVTHDTLSVISVNKGQLGFAWYGNEPVVLLPGRYIIDSAQFAFGEVHAKNESLVRFGPITMMTVNKGMVRECFQSGERDVKEEGYYLINAPEFKAEEQYSIQEKFIEFKSPFDVTTHDGVTFEVLPLLNYVIKDPSVVAGGLGFAKLDGALIDYTDAAISHIFNNINHKEFSPVTLDSANGEEQKREKEEAQFGGHQNMDGEDVRSRISKYILTHVQHDTKHLGVEIIGVQLQYVRFKNKTFASQVEQAALEASTQQAKLKAMQAKNRVHLAESQGRVVADRVNIEGQRANLKTQAEGDAERIAIAATAAAGKQRQEAEAQAYQISITAKAENEALEAKGRALTGGVLELERSRFQSEAAKQALSGLQTLNLTPSAMPQLSQLLSGLGLFPNRGSEMDCTPRIAQPRASDDIGIAKPQ